MSKKLQKQPKQQTKRDIRNIVLLSGGVYLAMLTAYYVGGGPDQCATGKEVAEGCVVSAPIILAFIVPALLLGGALFAVLVQRKVKPRKRK